MILTNSNISVPFNFEKHKVYSLVLENTKNYVSLCKQLLNYNENETSFYVYENSEKANFDNTVDVVYDFFNLSLESKKISNYLFKYLTAHINSNDYKIELAQINTDLNKFNKKLLNKIDFHLTHNAEINFQDIFKIEDYKIENSNNLLLNIVNYIDIMVKLTGKKTFVFIGAELFLEKEEVLELKKQCEYYQVNILLVSPFEKYTYTDIPTVVIDNDLCEILKNFNSDN